MSPDYWIVIPGWDKFQHYKRRDPSWIKVYPELLVKPEYLDLTEAERGLLHTAWLAYSLHARALRVSDLYRYLHRSSRRPNIKRMLESLNHAGFIELSASKPLALPRAGARAEEREEERTLNPQPPLDQPREWLRNLKILKEMPE